MAIMCNICQTFASMSAQSVLDHCPGFKANDNKEHAEYEGPTEAPNKKKKSQGQKEASQSHGPDAAKRS